MVSNPSHALANEICNGLGGLLDLSNSNNTSVNMPLLAGKAVKHCSMETGQAHTANTMDLAGIINQVQQSLHSQEEDLRA